MPLVREDEIVGAEAVPLHHRALPLLWPPPPFLMLKKLTKSLETNVKKHLTKQKKNAHLIDLNLLK